MTRRDFASVVGGGALAARFGRAQSRSPIPFGFMPGTVASASTISLQNASANVWPAFGFTLASNKTLSEVMIYISAIGGSPATGMTATLYADVSGAPGGSALATATVSTSITGAGSYSFTGFSYSLTAGVEYWIVFKNTAGSPNTNYATIRYGAGGTGQIGMGSTKWGWGYKQSADGGSTWTAVTAANVFGMRLKFSDSTYAGLPTTSITTNTGIYGTRERGVLFTLPGGSNITYNVEGAVIHLTTVGNPTGNLVYKLYSGAGASPTPIAPALPVPLAALPASSSAAYSPGFFGSQQSLTGGTVLRLVGAESTQSDSSSNRFDPTIYTVENSAESLALVPLLAQDTLSTDQGSTFADTANAFMPFALLLNSTTPFTISAGGSSGPRGSIQ